MARIYGSRLQRLLDQPLKEGVCLRDELAGTDRKRIEALVALEQESLRLDECLQRLFGDAGEAAQSNLRGLRKRFNDAAARLGSELRFEVDSSKKSALDQRLAWFSGPDLGSADVARMSQQATASLDTSNLQRPRVRDPERRPIHVFVSYGHADHYDKAHALCQALGQRFKACRPFRVSFWMDDQLQFGRWRAQIAQELARCDYGVFLLSPALISSKYIERHEMPPFALRDGDAGKPCAVVGFKRTDFPRDDHKGIDDSQIFWHPAERKRNYVDCAGARQKDAFVDALYVRLVDAFHRLPPVPDGPASPRLDAEAALTAPTAADAEEHPMQRWAAESARQDIACLIRGKARRETWDSLERNEAGGDAGLDALDELMAWARDPAAPHFCAVLGQYGMGKTTTLKWFTRELLAQREQDPSLPLPIYIDLRYGEARPDQALPTLEELLEEHLRRSPHLSAQLRAADLIKQVREQGALIIFDGLDEKLVHYPPIRAREYIRTLWQILPYAVREQSAKPGKLLMSCRSHFFRDLAQQAGFLLGEGREDFRRGRKTADPREGRAEGDYRLLVMLPFNETQVHDYLKGALGDADAARAMRTIGEVHNLRELTERPVLLAHIAQHIGELELAVARGEVVNAASVYQRVVADWFTRDDGKHQIDAEHKRLLMQALAAHLHREGLRALPVAQLEAWFDEFLYRHPVIADAYRDRPREVLKEDLRTATLLVRPESGAEASEFRFAHSSLQEYFHAGQLLRALIDDDAAAWDIPRPSPETFDFLAYLLQLEAPRSLQRARQSWSQRLAQGGAAAVNALRLWLRARALGAPEPEPTRVVLDDADLQDLAFLGSEARPLRLPQASFGRAWLMRTRWRHVELVGTDFSQAHLEQAEFDHCRLDCASFAGAKLQGALFREGSAHDMQVDASGGACWLMAQAPTGDTANARGARRDAPRATLGRRSGHTASVSAVACAPDGRTLLSGAGKALRLWDRESGQCLRVLEGHTDWITSVAYAPDGQTLLSGAWDHTLRLWDRESGQCLRVYQGHTERITSVAYAPDGHTLLSGAWDRTVRLWDLESGQCLAVFEGHKGWISSVAYAPDGHTLLSGAHDRTLRLWDRESGQCLRVLQGHTHRITSVAYAPDGHTLLSGADDCTFRLWDRESGECLRVFEGHKGWITSVAYAPDGRTLLSGAHDRTVRLWDRESGRCFRVYPGHARPVTSVAYAADGRTLLSGAGDQTVRLWDRESGQCLRVYPGHEDWIRSVAYAPDGRTLLSGAHDHTLRLWDRESGQCLRVLEGHAGAISSVAYAPDGRTLISGSWDATLRLWDQKSGQCLRVFQGHTDSINSVAYAPDGRTVLSGAHDRTLRLWDRESGQCLRAFEAHEAWITSVAYAPDGRALLSGAWDGTLRLWDRESGQCLRVFEGNKGWITSVAYAPDGQTLLSGAWDGTLRLWDRESGQCLRVYQGHTDRITSVAYAPDGRTLLSGADDHTLRLWDRESGQCLRVFEGHKSWITSVAYAPDGHTVLSAGHDHTLRLWDLATGECLKLILPLPEAQHACLSGDGRRVISASAEAWRHLEARIPCDGHDDEVLPVEAVTGPWAQVIGAAP